jgi:hypothetical protein
MVACLSWRKNYHPEWRNPWYHSWSQRKMWTSIFRYEEDLYYLMMMIIHVWTFSVADSFDKMQFQKQETIRTCPKIWYTTRFQRHLIDYITKKNSRTQSNSQQVIRELKWIHRQNDCSGKPWTLFINKKQIKLSEEKSLKWDVSNKLWELNHCLVKQRNRTMSTRRYFEEENCQYLSIDSS